MTVATNMINKNEVKDYYWAYADILRGIGINESMYDQRILAFMALKLLIDNDKVVFNFDYKNHFGLSAKGYAAYAKEDTKSTFLNIIKNITDFGKNLQYFTQESQYNPDDETNLLAYLDHKKVFTLSAYIEELPNHYLEMVLDIYTKKANFKNYPKELYKELYESTIARMKKLSGDLTGQHFTQKSIIHLMCHSVLGDMKSNEKIAIYDPACGSGSMLMESAHYFFEKLQKPNIELYGQEYHGQTWLLAKIFLEISSLDGKTQGLKNIIAYGNTLTNPAFSEGINGQDSFDFIIANPPFGVDWKHDYNEIVENMKDEKYTSHFYVVKDEKGKPVLPKKSDGQFLFMMHIINLMLKEKARGKRAKAAVVSSSTLISTGSKTGSESKIRNAIFNEQIVSGVLEQPNAMFTNTDISSHIWFLDSEPHKTIKIIKADTKEETLYIPHPEAKDKMKNSYSDANIKALIKYLNVKKTYPYISKNISAKESTEINISNEIGFRNTNVELDLDILEKELKNLMNGFCDNFEGLFDA